MRKSFKYFLAIWFICLLTFLAFVFIIPSTIDGKTIIQLVSLISIKDAYIMSLSGIGDMVFTKYGGAFWPCFILIILTFLINLLGSHHAFAEKNNQKFFYNIPLIKISYTGLLLNLIFGTICMFIPGCPIWLGSLVCALIILITILSMIKASALSEIVSKKDDDIKASTANMKRLVALAETNYKNESDATKKEELRKVYEALKYSNPVSSEETKDIELEIENNLLNVDVVNKLIEERNTKLKTIIN